MITILAGDQRQIDDRIEADTREFLESNQPLAVSRLAAEETNLADLQADLAASSLFHPCRLIIVRNLDRCPDFASTAESGSKKAQELVADLLGRANPAHQLILTIDRSSKSAAAVWLRRQTGYLELKPLTSRDLAAWLTDRAAAAGSQLDSQTADFLINHYGHDGVGLATEIAKLSLHSTITPELIRAVVVPVLPEAQVFDLTDALISGRTDRALEIYDILRAQNSRPEALRGLLGLIIWQVRILVAAKTSRQSSRDLADGLGLKGDYPIKKAQAASRRLGRRGLTRLVDSCLATDRQIRVDFRSPADCLPNLIIRAASICRPA